MARSPKSSAEAIRSASDAASQVGGAIKDAANQAFTATTKKADDVAANLGGSIRQFGDRIQANSPDGYLGCAAEAVADRVKRGGEYLEDAKFSGATDDLAELIRRNPIPAVLIAAGLAWFLERRI